MLTEATGPLGPGSRLPGRGYRRQSWQPPALRGTESMLAGISRRNRPLNHLRARLTAWYEQLARRGQPLIGWPPLTTGLFSHMHAPEGGRQSEDRPSQKGPQMISTQAPTSRTKVSDSVVGSVAQDQWRPIHSHRLPLISQTPQRPFLFLRSLSGPIQRGAQWMPSSQAGDAPGYPGTPRIPIEGAAHPIAPPRTEGSLTNPPVPPPAAEDKRFAAEVRSPAREDDRAASHEDLPVVHEVPPVTDDGLPAPKGPGAAPEDWRRALPMAAAPQRHREEPFVRPVMRLATFRPITTPSNAEGYSQSGSTSSGSTEFSLVTGEKKNYPGLEGLELEDQPAFRPRLVSSVSSFPRQEVHGGFPIDLKTEVRPDRDTPSASPVAVPAPVFGSNVEAASLTGSDQVNMSEPAGVIERLINQTVAPVALPGIQLRLLTPDAAEAASKASTPNTPQGGRSTAEKPKEPAPISATPPPLDIDAVANKVYQTLQRRHRLEQERRGLY